MRESPAASRRSASSAGSEARGQRGAVNALTPVGYLGAVHPNPATRPVPQPLAARAFNVFAVDNFPWNALTEEPARGPLALLMTQDNDFLPNIVLDFEQSEDFTTFTLHLRPGMRPSSSDSSPPQ